MQSVCSEVRFCEKSRVKRSFWKLGLSLFVKVSWKMLVLEAWLVTFGESLVENACFGSLSGLQGCPDKRGKQECQARVSSKSVKKECQAKSVQQECLAGVSCNSVQQECQSRNV